MRHRDNFEFDNLNDILHHMGDADRAGKSGTWVAKNYSLSQLIKDLQKVKENQDAVSLLATLELSEKDQKEGKVFSADQLLSRVRNKN